MATAKDVLDRAKILVENGEIEKAKKFYEVVIERMPNSEEAKTAQACLDKLNTPLETNFDDLFEEESLQDDNAPAQGLNAAEDWQTAYDNSQPEDHASKIKLPKKAKKVKAPKPKKPFYKKWWFWVIIVVVLLIIIGSALGGGSGSSTSKPGKPIKDSEVESLFKNADDYKGRSFTFTAKVFNVGDDDYFQAWYDIENSKKDVYVECSSDIKAKIKEDEYVRVKATVDGKETGENLLGGSVDVVKVTAQSVEKISASDAIQAVKSVDVNQTVTQGSVAATISKIDFTKSGYLRIYIHVQNNGSQEADIYPDQGHIIQNGKQIEADMSFEDYPEVSSPIAAGASSDGVILFKTSEQTGFTYSFSGYDNDANELNYSYNIQF